MNDHLINIIELAEYLGIKPMTLYAKVSAKEIPHYKVGRLVRFKKKEIDQWLSNLKQNPIDQTDINKKVRSIINQNNSKEIDINKAIKKCIEEAKKEG